MAITYSDAVKTTRMGAVNTALATGFVIIGTSALSGATGVLATIPLAATAGTVSGTGTVILTLTPAGMSDTAADATGTAAKAELRAANGTTVVASGLTVTATGGGGDIQLSTVSIVQNATVTLTSAVITHG